LPFTVEGADAGSVVRADNSGAVRVVETVRLRPYLETGVDFLKLDIEGAETEVLEDSADLLGNVKCVFVEYHSFVDKPQTLHTVAGILSGAGFRLHVHSELVSPTPFQKRESYLGMDMLLHLFGFRD
jgi:hypothetical protein